MKPEAFLFVAVQVISLGYLLLTGPWFATPRWIFIEIIGIYLAFWAVWRIRLRQLRIWPDPAPKARLVTRGPYRFVRHPIYTAVLFVTLAIVLSKPTPLRVVAWIVLLLDLLAKAGYEEKLLRQRFPDYAAYQRRTKRFLPFLFLLLVGYLPC